MHLYSFTSVLILKLLLIDLKCCCQVKFHPENKTNADLELIIIDNNTTGCNEAINVRIDPNSLSSRVSSGTPDSAMIIVADDERSKQLIL